MLASRTEWPRRYNGIGGPHPSQDVKLFTRNYDFEPDTGVKAKWAAGRMKVVDGETIVTDPTPMDENRPLTIQVMRSSRQSPEHKALPPKP